MTLETCMEIGKECGLNTIEEWYDNIVFHAISIFSYEDITVELLELQKDIFYHHPDEFCKIFTATKEELIAKGWKIKNNDDE